MADAAPISRADALRNYLCALGMKPGPAIRISNRCVVGQPLARRVGVDKLAQAFEKLGLEGDAAMDGAALVTAFELMGMGVSYGGVLKTLDRFGVPPDNSVAAAIDAARLIRAHQDLVVEEPPWTWLVPTLALGAGLAAALVHLLLNL